MSLDDYGFASFVESFAARSAPGEIPGRVVSATRGHYRVVTADGEIETTLLGRAAHAGVAIAVGDWVRLAPDSLRVIEPLPRTSLFSRRAAGARPDEQLVAANVDVALVVMGLDGDFNPRRLERYLTVIWNAGARPAVALSKADVAPDLARQRAEIEAVAPGVEVVAVSSLTESGLAPLAPLMRPRDTVVLLGSSGAGKSTLLNRLAGVELQATRAVRDGDDRGRHTTTGRELFRLPSGVLVIDTPGMRELALFHGDVDEAFADVAALAAGCRFGDCRHEREPGCAVRRAIDDGALDEARLESWRALGRELAYVQRQQDPALMREHRQRWKAIHIAARQRAQVKGR
ncbi:MAG: ribosome small subunit-dependent GTPase A [Deltaproteobacteria bacterium]|nr:ribosome small subunit-dependent GTPase A [Deltaproteobacteria bacterium]